MSGASFDSFRGVTAIMLPSHRYDDARTTLRTARARAKPV